MKINNLALFLACLTAANFASAQSPWTRSKGGAYAQLAYHFIPTYDKVFDLDGNEGTLPREISEGTLQLYGEYGLNANSTVVLSLPYRMIRTGDSVRVASLPKGSEAGIGNFTLALRQSLWKKDVNVALTLRCDLPAKKFDETSGIRLGYDAVTVTPILSAGMGFKKAYAYAYGGYGFRSSGYTPFVQVGAEGGLHLGKLWLIAFADVVQAVGDGDITFPPSNQQTYLYVNEQQHAAIGAKAIFEFNRFLGVFGSFAGVVSAKNLPRSPGIGLGAFFKWQ